MPKRRLANQRVRIRCSGIRNMHRCHHHARLLKSNTHAAARLRARPIEDRHRLAGRDKHAIHARLRVGPNLKTPPMIRQDPGDLPAHTRSKLRQHDHIRCLIKQREHNPRRAPSPTTVQDVPRQDRKRLFHTQRTVYGVGMTNTAADIAVSRQIPGELVVPNATVRVLGDEYPDRADLLAFVEGAHIIVTMYTEKVDSELLDAAGPQLKGVCNFAVGVNNIDFAECAKRGIKVSNTPDAVTEGTADLAWLLTLAVARRLIEADQYARSSTYPERGALGMAEFMGLDLTGRTLLIVGAGRIGFATAMRARAWGMRVLYVARSRHWDFELAPLAAERVSLADGLRAADVVSVHTPLTPETTHLMDEAHLKMMKPSAILVNTSRGPVVDEAALARALHDGRLWGAGLDVFEREPEIHPDILTAPNTVLTPHIGSAEKRFRELMTAMVGDNATAILAGRTPPNEVHG